MDADEDPMDDSATETCEAAGDGGASPRGMETVAASYTGGVM